MTGQLNDTSVRLHETDTPAWQLWAQLATLAHHLKPGDWILVGGQMVALHCHLGGITPGRTTTDIDVVANVEVTDHALSACRQAASALGLEPAPSLNAKHLHRFQNDAMVLDIMVPDHAPKHLVLRIAGHDPVPIVGGRRALQRAAQCTIDTAAGIATIPLPDLRGALVLKARASVADTRDRDRHLYDIAQLCAIVRDPLELADELDKKERKYLRAVPMPTQATADPWLRIDISQRADAVEAWETLTDSR